MTALAALAFVVILAAAAGWAFFFLAFARGGE